MSHFVLLVLGDGDLNERLAPFCEQDENYFEFEDRTEEWRKEWETETHIVDWPKRFEQVKEIGMKDDFPILELAVNKWATQPAANDYIVCRDPETNGGKYYTLIEKHVFHAGDGIEQWIAKPAGEPVKVPFKETYPEFEEFVSKYHGGHMDDGRAGLRRNPRAKWDWWSLGGRWADFFYTDKTDSAPTDLRRSELPLEELAAEAKTRAERRWTTLRSVLPEGVFDGFKTFESEVNKPDWNAQTFDAQPARRELNERLKDLERAAHPDDKEWAKWLNFSRDSLDELSMPLEEYLEYAQGQSVTPFAILTEDGAWMERAEMGWFGCAHDAVMTHAKWVGKVRALLRDMDPDTRIRVVDCHI